MLKRALFYLFILNSFSGYACYCTLPPTAVSYNAAELIFIGKYTGKVDIGNANGLPLEFANFEVLKFLKGPDIEYIRNLLEEINRSKAEVSLMEKESSSCWHTFYPERYYLIYAYDNSESLFYTTDGCCGTHEIAPEELDDYLAEYSPIEEVKELNQLFRAEYPEGFMWEQRAKDDFVPIEIFMEAQSVIHTEKLEKQIVIWVTMPVIVLLVSGLILQRVRYSKV
jgi:hypothetical protein